MKTYKQIKRDYFDKVLDTHICDLCGAKTKDENNWPNKEYNSRTTEISLTEGNHYGAEYSLDKLSFDICPCCFRNKLMVWFLDQGITPTKSDICNF